MTIKEIIKKNKLQTEVDEIKRFSAVDIDYVTKAGVHCETQLNVSHHILTKAGIEELEELFDSLTKEFNTKSNRILSCTVVASADTEEELEKMGYEEEYVMFQDTLTLGCSAGILGYSIAEMKAFEENLSYKNQPFSYKNDILTIENRKEDPLCQKPDTGKKHLSRTRLPGACSCSENQT